ncbi:uncharacterized protein N0V89_005490 [Didymosphaeria variabile]|uniref:Leucine-rich repeat domain-containing protein n=1 Tax=Didymosphaeria variabile TaxID=1932322 RepID=A0A9W8XN93_9PLEO|nr:uncharacterized protein N0V89_005490 [Didymosphaeria variabile]KAJ4353760.1 hypothetical protein N0V89_005490 [Didymosphaeria variabile]
MCSDALDNSPKLNELPGELILEILQHLTVVRGYLALPEEEAARKAENAQRIAALHGLSLACRRLNYIATPYLYESITNLGQSTNWTNVDSLLNTIKKKPAFLNFIRYIETDGDEFDAALGSELETKLEGLRRIDYDAYNYDTCIEERTRHIMFPCIVVVSTLISLARNLESLAIDRRFREDLQPFEKTLEFLALDTLDSSWLVELEEDIPTIGSLREFTNLKHVEVSGMVLWSDDDGTVKHPRLSSILPSALETLIVNVEWEDDVEEALADLAKDCAVHFPDLKKVDCSWRPAPMFVGRDLITEFEKAGVSLKLDIASTTEEEEKRIEAEMIQMEQDIEYMDERAEAIEEEIRRFDEEVTQMEEVAHAQETSSGKY